MNSRLAIAVKLLITTASAEVSEQCFTKVAIFAGFPDMGEPFDHAADLLDSSSEFSPDMRLYKIEGCQGVDKRLSSL